MIPVLDGLYRAPAGRCVPRASSRMPTALLDLLCDAACESEANFALSAAMTERDGGRKKLFSLDCDYDCQCAERIVVIPVDRI